MSFLIINLPVFHGLLPPTGAFFPSDPFLKAVKMMRNDRGCSSQHRPQSPGEGVHPSVNRGTEKGSVGDRYTLQYFSAFKTEGTLSSARMWVNLIECVNQNKDTCLREPKNVQLIASKNKTVVLRGRGREGAGVCQTSAGQKRIQKAHLQHGNSS